METLRKTFIVNQPGKAIWAIVAIAFNAVRLPFWIIKYIPSSLRPNKGWSYRQAIMVRIVKAFLWNVSFVEAKTPLSLEPGKEKDQFVVIPPGKKEYYTGVVEQDPEIAPVPVGGTWYPVKPKNPAPESSAEKPDWVVLHFHGGAYVVGDGRIKDAGFAAKTFLDQTPASHVLATQYRLASNPLGRFPAQLQDAISSYAYLVNTIGVPPHKIVLSGDSAGANLALALTRYLTEKSQEIGLQMPACTWLWSPWVIIEKGLDTRNLDENINEPTDFLCGDFGYWGASSFHPSKATGLDITDKYICSVGNAFSTPVPIHISSGECEILLAEDTALAQEMRAFPENKINFEVEPLAPHDITLVGHMLGFEKEAQVAAKKAGEFLLASQPMKLTP